MLPLPSPSDVLELDLLTPADLGIDDTFEEGGRIVSDVDAGRNFLHRKIEESALRLHALVPGEMSVERFKLGVSYWALAETYLALARQRGRVIGQVSDRTGQMTISAAAPAANRAAAEELYDKLKDLYPETVFPQLGKSAGGSKSWKRQ